MHTCNGQREMGRSFLSTQMKGWRSSEMSTVLWMQRNGEPAAPTLHPQGHNGLGEREAGEHSPAPLQYPLCLCLPRAGMGWAALAEVVWWSEGEEGLQRWRV